MATGNVSDFVADRKKSSARRLERIEQLTRERAHTIDPMSNDLPEQTSGSIVDFVSLRKRSSARRLQRIGQLTRGRSQTQITDEPSSSSADTTEQMMPPPSAKRVVPPSTSQVPPMVLPSHDTSSFVAERKKSSARKKERLEELARYRSETVPEDLDAIDLALASDDEEPRAPAPSGPAIDPARRPWTAQLAKSVPLFATTPDLSEYAAERKKSSARKIEKIERLTRSRALVTAEKESSSSSGFFLGNPRTKSPSRSPKSSPTSSPHHVTQIEPSTFAGMQVDDDAVPSDNELEASTSTATKPKSSPSTKPQTSPLAKMRSSPLSMLRSSPNSSPQPKPLTHAKSILPIAAPDASASSSGSSSVINKLSDWAAKRKASTSRKLERLEQLSRARLEVKDDQDSSRNVDDDADNSVFSSNVFAAMEAGASSSTTPTPTRPERSASAAISSPSSVGATAASSGPEQSSSLGLPRTDWIAQRRESAARKRELTKLRLAKRESERDLLKKQDLETIFSPTTQDAIQRFGNDDNDVESQRVPATSSSSAAPSETRPASRSTTVPPEQPRRSSKFSSFFTRSSHE
eukprot:c8384_g1_i1.p1 GENE.c8384_g1_i1~~c8384_g1_i1.p1  ORF type:complete len:629 (-),score=134.14 c8384_g1_i1:348-2081(-)